MALLQASIVSVYLDPRDEGVRVPVRFKQGPQLMLQIGLNMPVPIPDLELSEEALGCTLSFNRRPEYCHIPWRAIYALVAEDGRGMIWPEDVPPEVAVQAEGRASTARPGGHLHAVPDAPDAKGGAAKSPSEKRKKKSGKTRAAEGKARAVATTPSKVERSQEVSAPVAEGKSGGSSAEEAPPRKGKRELPSYLRVVK